MANTNPYQEQELLQRVSEGDETAFRQVYDAWHAKVYSLSMYLTRSAFMSEEITQEVFVKIWNSRRQLAAVTYFASWIRTIARNTIINYLKVKAREQLALLQYQGALPDQYNDTAVLDREYARLFRQVIDDLPPQQKKSMATHQGIRYDACTGSTGNGHYPSYGQRTSFARHAYHSRQAGWTH